MSDNDDILTDNEEDNGLSYENTDESSNSDDECDEVELDDNMNHRYNIISKEETYNKYYCNNKETKPYISKFEKTKILGMRASQLENGDEPLITVPGDIYDANYEKIIDNSQYEIKELIKFCELTWEDSCLHFHKNKTPIKTMSTAQARQPIYKSSINSHKKFSSFLEDLNNNI